MRWLTIVQPRDFRVVLLERNLQDSVLGLKVVGFGTVSTVILKGVLESFSINALALAGSYGSVAATAALVTALPCLALIGGIVLARHCGGNEVYWSKGCTFVAIIITYAIFGEIAFIALGLGVICNVALTILLQ